MKSLLMKSTCVFWLSCWGMAAPVFATEATQLLQGFPPDIALERLWDSARFGGKESQTYRFNSKKTLPEIRQTMNAWLAHPGLAPQAVERDGWSYLSHQKMGWWVTVQARELQRGESLMSVEGLVTFWRTQKSGSSMATDLPFEKLAALQAAKVIRRMASADNGKQALTVTLISTETIGSIAKNLAADFQTLGLRPAPFSPPALQSVLSKNEASGSVSQAWLGANSQLMLTIFEHRGNTAILIHWTTGRQEDEKKY